MNDYKGRQGKRRRRIAYRLRGTDAKARRKRWIRRALLALCAAVALYCVVRLTLYAASSIATYRKNKELQALHAQGATDTPAPTDAYIPDDTAAPTDKPTPYIPGAATAIPQPQATLRPRYQAINPIMLDSMRPLYARNNDLTGWVYIPGVVDLPVVYRDNVYYLNHDFDGKKNTAGTLFMDVHHPFTAKTQYMVVHGHNMNDGSMFGLLAHFEKKLSYVREHGIVHFTTLYKKETYAVFSVMVVPDRPGKPGYVPYLGNPTFYSERQFYSLISDLKAGSLFYIPIDVDASDALLTLSTCIDEERLIVVCRRLRDGETETDVRRQLYKSTAR